MILATTHLLSREEEQNIALHLLTHVYLYDSPDGGFQVVPLRLRGVEDLHRMGAAGNAHERRVVKVVLQCKERTHYIFYEW